MMTMIIDMNKKRDLALNLSIAVSVCTLLGFFMGGYNVVTSLDRRLAVNEDSLKRFETSQEQRNEEQERIFQSYQLIIDEKMDALSQRVNTLSLSGRNARNGN